MTFLANQHQQEDYFLHIQVVAYHVKIMHDCPFLGSHHQISTKNTVFFSFTQGGYDILFFSIKFDNSFSFKDIYIYIFFQSVYIFIHNSFPVHRTGQRLVIHIIHAPEISSMPRQHCLLFFYVCSFILGLNVKTPPGVWVSCQNTIWSFNSFL